MKKRELEKFKWRAEIMKALAHPSRLFIVDRLGQREHCVCELTKMIGADVSTVSKHLTVLKNAGLVADEKRGSKVFYKLQAPCILTIFDCVESVIKDSARHLMSLTK